MSHHIVTGNWSQVLSKSKKCSKLRSHLSTPLWHYLIRCEVFKRWGLGGSLSPCLASCGKPLKVMPTSVMILGYISFVLSGVTLYTSLRHILPLPWNCPTVNCTLRNDEAKWIWSCVALALCRSNGKSCRYIRFLCIFVSLFPKARTSHTINYSNSYSSPLLIWLCYRCLGHEPRDGWLKKLSPDEAVSAYQITTSVLVFSSIYWFFFLMWTLNSKATGSSDITSSPNSWAVSTSARKTRVWILATD